MFRVLRDADILLPDFDTLTVALAPEERLTRMQELLEDRKTWAAQPETPERDLALKAISNSLRKLGQGASTPPQAS
jgi:hypothetical protein